MDFAHVGRHLEVYACNGGSHHHRIGAKPKGPQSLICRGKASLANQAGAPGELGLQLAQQVPARRLLGSSGFGVAVEGCSHPGTTQFGGQQTVGHTIDIGHHHGP